MRAKRENAVFLELVIQRASINLFCRRERESEVERVDMRALKLEVAFKRGPTFGKDRLFKRFSATIGAETVEIDSVPWGKGHLRFNGQQIAHINDAKDRTWVQES